MINEPLKQLVVKVVYLKRGSLTICRKLLYSFIINMENRKKFNLPFAITLFIACVFLGIIIYPKQDVQLNDFTKCDSVVSWETLKTWTPWQLLDRQDCLQRKIDDLLLQKKEAQTLRDQKRGVVSVPTEEVKTEENPITQLNKAMGLE